MKKRTARLIIIAVIVTIVVNGALIIMLWSKDSSSIPSPPVLEDINSFIIKEMAYDQDQANQFRSISQQHHETQFELQMNYRNIKHRLNRAMVAKEDSVVHELIAVLTDVVREKETELFRFFSEVRTINTEEQQKRFAKIFREATGAPEYERNPMQRRSKNPHPPKH